MVGREKSESDQTIWAIFSFIHPAITFPPADLLGLCTPQAKEILKEALYLRLSLLHSNSRLKGRYDIGRSKLRSGLSLRFCQKTSYTILLSGTRLFI